MTYRLAALIPLVFIAPDLLSAPRSLIGQDIPPVPAGCEQIVSGVLGDSDLFAYQRMVCDKSEIVVLARFIERRGKAAYWRVVDEIYLPVLNQGVTALDVPLCKSASFGSNILATGRWSNPGQDGSFVATDISQAWRFDLEQSKIEPISVTDVVCEGEYAD